MSDDWDKQRDLAAEGQRAMLAWSPKVLQRRGMDRIVGLSCQGQPVDNVHEGNRFTVDKKRSMIEVSLLSEDKSREITRAFIPNTRERPDAIVYKGIVFEVVNTNRPFPEYRQVMQLEAIDLPFKPERHDETESDTD